MENKSFLATLKKNAMLIVMVLVYLFFLVMTKGGIFNPSSFTELINQNANASRQSFLRILFWGMTASLWVYNGWLIADYMLERSYW